jgi:hypothetical protein
VPNRDKKSCHSYTYTQLVLPVRYCDVILYNRSALINTLNFQVPATNDAKYRQNNYEKYNEHQQVF